MRCVDAVAAVVAVVSCVVRLVSCVESWARDCWVEARSRRRRASGSGDGALGGGGVVLEVALACLPFVGVSARGIVVCPVVVWDAGDVMAAVLLWLSNLAVRSASFVSATLLAGLLVMRLWQRRFTSIDVGFMEALAFVPHGQRSGILFDPVGHFCERTGVRTHDSSHDCVARLSRFAVRW